MALPQKTSVFGRLLGIGFSGEPLSNLSRIDVGEINTSVGSSGATISNHGLTRVNSTATAANLLLEAPTEGCRVEINIISSASLVTINAAAAGFTIGTSSTALVFTGAAANALKNYTAVLRGISTTAYALVSGSTTVVSLA